MITVKNQLEAMAETFAAIERAVDLMPGSTIGSVTSSYNADHTIHIRSTITDTAGRKFIDSYNWSPVGGLVWCDLQEVTL